MWTDGINPANNMCFLNTRKSIHISSLLSPVPRFFVPCVILGDIYVEQDFSKIVNLTQSKKFCQCCFWRLPRSLIPCCVLSRVHTLSILQVDSRLLYQGSLSCIGNSSILQTASLLLTYLAF